MVLAKACDPSADLKHGVKTSHIGRASHPVSSMYIWSKNPRPVWRKLTSSAIPFLLFLFARLMLSCKKFAAIWCFDFDLNIIWKT
jgi:hypothetical protein